MTPNVRRGYTLIEILVAITIGMYICMLSTMLLVAVQRSVRSIDSLASQQATVRVACQRGALQGLLPEDFPSQQIALKTMMVAGVAQAAYAYGVVFPAGRTYPFRSNAECAYASYYGLMNPIRVTAIGASLTAGNTGAWSIYRNKTVIPLDLEQSTVSSTGRPVLLMDPERQLVSVQSLGLVQVAGVYQTFSKRIYVLPDAAGTTAPANLLSQTGQGQPANLFLGDRLHVLAPRL